MKTRWLLSALGAATLCAGTTATLAACATDAGSGDGPSADTNTPVPTPVTDGGVDAAVDEDATVCVKDCEFYPDECTDDALCMSPLFDPDSPTALDLRTGIYSLTGRSPNDAWLAGAAGTIARFDGTSWSRSVTGIQNSLYGFWLMDGAEVAFDDPTRLYTRGLDVGADAEVSDGGWSPFTAVTVPTGIGQWRNLRVTTTWAPPGSRTLYVGATASSSSAGAGVWRLRYSAADNNFTFSAACNPSTCPAVNGLHGLSADELWAVSQRGAAFRVTGADSDTPTVTFFNTLTVYALHGVWAFAPNDVWAVGASGTVRRYRGDVRFWEVYEDLPTQQHLYAIAGSSPSDIWVAGEEGTVFHYDGNAWTRMKVAGLRGRRPRLDRIWIPSPGKVWIAGQGALVSLGGKP